MDTRYSHWFWNSRPVNALSRAVVWLNNWLWVKQYGSQYKNDYWHST